MRILIALAALAAAVAPAAASAQAWVHQRSGVSLASLPDGLRLGGETDNRRDGSDVWIQLGTDDEPVTLYVYRSAFPNPALWFERTRLAMHANVGTANEAVAPRSFTLGGATAPNGLREEVAIPASARFRSTAVAIAQAGEWIVKARITSASLDREGIGRKMDRLLAALRLPPATAAPLPLLVPGLCPGEQEMRGRPRRQTLENVTLASPLLAAAHDQARGRSGLAAEPNAWCRESSNIPAEYVTVYRRRDGGAWTALVGDSGVAVSGYVMAVAELPDLDGAATVGANPSATALALVYDGLPDPDGAIEPALPFATGQQRAVAQIDGDGAREPDR
ncbi:MAG TPA: hypothetical protein VN231_10665 [Allosphingosinicella sp.]|nr:hypothetical protein [Allosphingosinicella sp.]